MASHPNSRLRGPKGSDGLTARQRKFAELRRADPIPPNWEIMRACGFAGSKQRLAEKARRLLQNPWVAIAVRAPDPVQVADAQDEAGLKLEMRRHLLAIVRGAQSASDKVKAIDKVLATIPGGYVPVQVDMSGKLTMEGIIRAMGGAPEAQSGVLTLAPPQEEESA